MSGYCVHARVLSLQSCPIFCDPWTVAHQAPLFVGFFGQEYWSGLPCSPPKDLPPPRDWTQSSCVASIVGTFFTTEPPGKPCLSSNICFSAVVVSPSGISDSLWPPWTASCQVSCPSLSLGVCSNSSPSSWWCHPTISSSVVPFSSCLQSSPASGSFAMSQLFASVIKVLELQF